ncbi:MAG: hypothetical protein QME71_02830 [Dehalococcoidia bacterium]|nr:hypothetical protein [Dehalococcoidia bacterium]
MIDYVLKPITAILDWALRRSTRGLITHIREARRVGGEDDPGIYVAVVVENPQGQNAFVDRFEVEMLRPLRREVDDAEYRSQPAVTIGQLALNIPGHGLSDPVIVIAKFSAHISYEEPCVARIAAVGRKGFRRRWQPVEVPPLREGQTEGLRENLSVIAVRLLDDGGHQVEILNRGREDAWDILLENHEPGIAPATDQLRKGTIPFLGAGKSEVVFLTDADHHYRLDRPGYGLRLIWQNRDTGGRYVALFYAEERKRGIRFKPNSQATTKSE